MEINERLIKLTQATPEQLAKIDAILNDQVNGNPCIEKDIRLISVSEASKLLGLTYATFHRRMQDGYFDVVNAGGRNLVRYASVLEFSQGKRHPRVESIAARKARVEVWHEI